MPNVKLTDQILNTRKFPYNLIAAVLVKSGVAPQVAASKEAVAQINMLDFLKRVDALPEAEEDALLLCYQFGLTHSGIAARRRIRAEDAVKLLDVALSDLVAKMRSFQTPYDYEITALKDKIAALANENRTLGGLLSVPNKTTAPEDILIEEMGFSTRTMLSLRRGGVETLQDLSRMSHDEIKDIHGIGDSIAEEVFAVCADYGVKVKRSSSQAQEKDFPAFRGDRLAVVPGDIPIEKAKLSNRTVHILRRAHIMTMKDLSRRKPEDLRQLRGLGDKSFNEIITACAAFTASEKN